MGRYLRPRALEDAVAALADGRCTVLAGGTDVYPARVGPVFGEEAVGEGAVGEGAFGDDFLDVTGLKGLRAIEETADGWRLGALTTWTDILRRPLPPAFTALKQAAREIGGVQIQNAGTLAGNLCNASPAADGVPPLLAMDAEVELASRDGIRRLALDDFILGNRRTARRPDELVTAIIVPKLSKRAHSRFLKLGARRYLVISIVMVATLVELDADGRIAKARVAVGSCAARAHRLPAVEAALAGQSLDGELSGRVGPEQLGPEQLGQLAPIDDIRGSAAYRREAAAVLIRRSLEALQIEAAA